MNSSCLNVPRYNLDLLWDINKLKSSMNYISLQFPFHVGIIHCFKLKLDIIHWTNVCKACTSVHSRPVSPVWKVSFWQVSKRSSFVRQAAEAYPTPRSACGGIPKPPQFSSTNINLLNSAHDNRRATGFCVAHSAITNG